MLLKLLSRKNVLMKSDLSFTDGEIENRTAYNPKRYQKLTITYLQNRHFLVSFMFETISSVVCFWIGAVKYCFVLKASLGLARLSILTSSQSSDVGIKSDEEPIHDKSFKRITLSAGDQGIEGNAEHDKEI